MKEIESSTTLMSPTEVSPEAWTPQIESEFPMWLEDVHVFWHAIEQKWLVRMEGSPLVLFGAREKREAIKAGKAIAATRDLPLVIHGKDGKVEEERSLDQLKADLHEFGAPSLSFEGWVHPEELRH